MLSLVENLTIIKMTLCNIKIPLFHTLDMEHRESELELRWKLPPCWLALITPDGDRRDQYHLAVDLVNYSTKMTDSVCSLDQ